MTRAMKPSLSAPARPRWTPQLLRGALALLAGGAMLAGCGTQQAGSRDQIRTVGSSTVYPFAKAVAEDMARSNPGIASPIIESTGTGAGINLFCGGVGVQHPDIANASRRMKASEFATCQQNGVTEIVEFEVGKDGIAIASARNGITIPLTSEEVYEAIAAEPYGEPNTARSWNDVNPSFPDLPILVYGPPATSGTRDALTELILKPGCQSDPETAALKETDEDRFEEICTEVRSDGAYVDQGENDNLIVQKIVANPEAVGIFGYSFLEKNANQLQGLTMNGVAPTYENIADGSYPGARPLYLYVKKAHLDAVPGLREYLAAWTENWEPDGLLTSLGMIASPEAVRAANARVVSEMTTLAPSDLK